MIAIFAIGMGCDKINSTRNEEFLAKTLEDQQKVCCIYEIDKHIWCPWSLCHMEIYLLYLDGGSIV